LFPFLFLSQLDWAARVWVPPHSQFEDHPSKLHSLHQICFSFFFFILVAASRLLPSPRPYRPTLSSLLPGGGLGVRLFLLYGAGGGGGGGGGGGYICLAGARFVSLFDPFPAGLGGTSFGALPLARRGVSVGRPLVRDRPGRTPTTHVVTEQPHGVTVPRAAQVKLFNGQEKERMRHSALCISSLRRRNVRCDRWTSGWSISYAARAARSRPGKPDVLLPT
jgi:hypothetical protein